MRPLTLIALAFLSISSLRAADDLDIVALVRGADKFTLYSLDPWIFHRADENGNLPAEDRQRERLHKYIVLGKFVAPDATTRETIRTAVLDALRNDYDGPTIMCFNPRHAVVVQKDSQRVDLLICFECGKCYGYYVKDGKEQRQYFTLGSGGPESLNQLLDSQKIPRDFPAGETSSK